MSFNGSGQFSINSTGQPVVGGTTITASVQNALTADLATGLSTAICKDGQQTITADIPFNNHKITGVAPATSRTDAASLATIQDGTGVYVSTVGGTGDVITLSPSPAIAAYVAGQTFRFLASAANTTNVTVAISGLAAKAITKNGTTALIANDILITMMVAITYDGTRFILGTHLTADITTLTGTQTLTNKTLSGGLVSADPVTALGIASKQYADAVGFTTGDVKLSLKTTADMGFVLMNDGSIGDATSGATTRANADTSALFTLLWTNVIDQWAPVSSGRGGSAAADYAAHKTLTLSKALGRALAGVGTGTTTETITGVTASANAVTVASNNTRWVTGMPVTVSGASGFAGLVNGSFFIIRMSSTSIKIATTLANAQNGTVVTVTGTGNATFTTTFATRALGESGGEDAHASSSTELLAHTHASANQDSTTPGGGFGAASGANGGTSGSFGGNVAMNILQPSLFLNVMIKL